MVANLIGESSLCGSVRQRSAQVSRRKNSGRCLAHVTVADELDAHELNAFSRRTGIAVTLAAPDDLRVASARGMAVYRIVQEALNDVARYSNASSVEVRLGMRGGSIELAGRPGEGTRLQRWMPHANPDRR